MKNLRNTIFRLLLITPMLLAFQCDDEPESALVFNDYRVSVSPNANFTTSDTIWIQGTISSKVFDAAVGDSIFYAEPFGDFVSVMKLKTDEQNSGNSIDALDKFQLANPLGTFEFLGACENSGVIPTGELSLDEQSYQYKLGLIPLEAGDYVLSWRNNTVLTNTERHLSILDDYPYDNDTNQLGFNKCGIVSVLIDVAGSNGEYFFSVE